MIQDANDCIPRNDDKLSPEWVNYVITVICDRVEEISLLWLNFPPLKKYVSEPYYDF